MKRSTFHRPASGPKHPVRGAFLRLAAVVVVLCSGMAVFAQQDYQFTQFQFNKLALNPAYAGSRGMFSSTAVYRHQWTGFEGAPRTMSLALHSPVGRQRLSIGALLFNDRLGVSQQTGLFVSTAYRLPTGEAEHLSVALQAGFIGYRNGLTDLNPRDPDDQLLQQDLSDILPNVGFGLYWHGERHFAGVSMPRVVQNDLTKLGDFDDEATAFLYRHLYAMGGYVFDLAPNLKLRPTALFKWVGGDGIAAPIDVDVNLSILLVDRLWLGAAYRLNAAAGLMAEYRINDQLMAGYAYDFSTTDLGNQHGGSHEIMLRYELNFNKDAWITPRYIRHF